MDKLNEFFIKKIVTPVDGVYYGTWSGYLVTFKYDGDDVQVRTKNGIKGINIPCVVVIKDGIPDVRVGD